MQPAFDPGNESLSPADALGNLLLRQSGPMPSFDQQPPQFFMLRRP
jgi:hypothetical protein